GLQTENSQRDKALELVKSTLTRFIESGPTEEELLGAKKNITGGFPLRIDSNNDLLEYLGIIGFYELPLTYLNDFVAKVDAVTTTQIRDAFRRRVDPKRLATVILGEQP
ncbi:MAG: M16 family metallopeptidase, partial [Acidiferrobacterales bacterium]